MQMVTLDVIEEGSEKLNSSSKHTVNYVKIHIKYPYNNKSLNSEKLREQLIFSVLYASKIPF